MNELLKSIFDELGFENFYNNKGSFEGECIVYNYISKSSYYADNLVKGREYIILLNVYLEKNKAIETISESIIEAMNANGIKGGTIENPILDPTGLYNTPIKFNGFIRKS